ncbi:MAG: PIG-L family deacetylase [Verrucomicrobiota bacterium]
MKLHNSTAEILVPAGKPVAEALKRVTRLGIGAHQDDLEFMAFHGIIAGNFGGITCTNGSGSARTGKFANFTDAQLMAVRRQEQNRAAELGRYEVMFQLDYPSAAVKSSTDTALRDDLVQILDATRPQVVYTHNLADKHDTHIGVAIAVIQAIRKSGQQPKVYGCEVWRDLDWLPDADKVVLDVSGHEELAGQLNGVFESQIAGGKRYDLAVQGRRRANATFFDSHAVDKSTGVAFALDLTPLVTEPTRDIAMYVTGFIDKFKTDVTAKLNQRLGS